MKNLVAVVVAVAVPLCACAPTRPASKPTQAAARPTAAPATAVRSLYDRLGGRAAITAVVDEFVGRVAADKRINARFFNTDIAKLRGLLVDFFCAATGGPAEYHGRDMHTAHASMNLVDEEWSALVEQLVGAFKKLQVPDAEQGEVLAALAPLKAQIVHPPPPQMARHDPALVQKGRALATSLRKAGRDKSADLLEVALEARVRGQRNYAEQIFSAAEQGLDPNALASLDPLFREGAPERITTKLRTMPKDTPAQPKDSVGSSDEEEAAAPRHAALAGTVRLDGEPLRRRLAVIMLTPLGGKYPRRPPRHRVIEQRDRQFAPHLMAVPVGSTVSFPNFDGIFHNVFSLSQTRAFDLGIYRNGETRDVTFTREGFVRLGCNLHANMSAYLIVVAAPHYVPTDDKGRFRFKTLTPGRYKARTWIEGMAEPVEQVVTIKEGDNTLDVAAQGAVASDLGPDKFGVARGPAAP
jgi:hemoglobin